MNSFHIFVRDAVGETFIHSFGKLDLEMLERAKAHGSLVDHIPQAPRRTR